MNKSDTGGAAYRRRNGLKPISLEVLPEEWEEIHDAAGKGRESKRAFARRIVVAAAKAIISGRQSVSVKKI